MERHQGKRLVRGKNHRAFLYGLILLFSGLLNPWIPESRCNDCSGITLSRIYTGNLQQDIFREGRTFHLQWDVNHNPLPLPYTNKYPEPKPKAERFIDKTKRKGITAKGPEPESPAFSGIFSGYPPCEKSFTCQSTFLAISSEKTDCLRIRPPPLQIFI
jgi:hypothetical protein